MTGIHDQGSIDNRRGAVVVHPGATVEIGARICGPVTLMSGAHVFPGAVIGCEAEHRSAASDWHTPIIIGARTKIREGCIVQRGLAHSGAHDAIFDQTRVGDGCLLSAGSHVGHNSQIENDVVLTTHAVLGGHVRVMAGAFLGLSCCVHQRVVVGSFAMIGMGAVVLSHVQPGRKVVGVPARDLGHNQVGLERAGIVDLSAEMTRWAHFVEISGRERVVLPVAVL